MEMGYLQNHGVDLVVTFHYETKTMKQISHIIEKKLFCIANLQTYGASLYWWLIANNLLIIKNQTQVWIYIFRVPSHVRLFFTVWSVCSEVEICVQVCCNLHKLWPEAFIHLHTGNEILKCARALRRRSGWVSNDDIKPAEEPRWLMGSE